MLRLNRKLLPLPLAAMLLLSSMPAQPLFAQGLTAAQAMTINIPAQPVDSALKAFVEQTKFQLIYAPDVVQGATSTAVSGKLSPLDALKKLLDGTGITIVSTGENAATLKKSSSVASQDMVDLTLTRVEVTGSRLKRVMAEGPAPVNVYTAKDIEKSGQPNLGRFLAGLNEVSASVGEGGFSATLAQGTVQLRGLPVGTTLVLINGRRVESVGSSAANFFNLNLIPTNAVERVEVVPVGSSAVYGGDALAGVVNVILKKSIDGYSMAANLDSGRGFGNGGLSLATGGRSAEGSYLVLGSYSRATPLTMLERPFFLDADYRRYGGPDARVRNCTPGTVTSVSGANLPGLNSSFAAIPQLASGQSPTLADFAATAGTANLCNRYADGDGSALVHADENFALHATGEHSIGGSWTAFGEFTLTQDRTAARDRGQSLNNLTVPASNAYNPFGQDVKVTTLLGRENGLQGEMRKTRFGRALVGVRGGLWGDWDAELTLSTARDDGWTRDLGQLTDTAARTAALASSSPATALNPFTAGRAASDSVLDGIWSDYVGTNHGHKDQIGAVARGSVLQLPAGPLEAVVGAESARDHYDFSIPTQQTDIRDGRHESAAYGELRAPLLSAGSPGSGWSLAALTLAARRDSYSDFGAANTYQTGLEFRPLRSLLIRASSATSFKPPSLLETNVSTTSYSTETFGLVDPARGGEAITSGTVLYTVNKDLEPEHGRANSFGAVWELEGGLGTHLSATHWQVHINGLIAQPAPQTVLNYESLFPGFVTRGPSVNGQPGPVTMVKVAYANFGSVDAAGTDMEAAYGWHGFMGRWTATAGATRTNEYHVVVAPGAPVEDRLGRRFTDFWAPRWKGRASIGLDEGSWSVGLTSRYFGQYEDAGTSTRNLGAYWMHDLAATMDLKKWLPGLAAGVKAASLSLSVINLTNRLPQFVETLPYYDVTQADWRGRYGSVRASVDW